MKKQILVLLIVLLITLPLVISADINLAASSEGATIIETGGAGSTSGTVLNIIDENYGTGFQRSRTASGSYSVTASAHHTTEIHFNTPLTTLTEVKYWAYYHHQCITGFASKSIASEYITLHVKQNGVWSVGDSDSSSLDFGSGSYSSTKTAQVLSGPWADVSDIRIYVESRSRCEKSRSGSYSISSTVNLREIEAWGESTDPYQDIGLKIYNGTTPVPIAIEMSEADSELKIYKNGTTYGVALIPEAEFGQSHDSGIRIKTSSGIQGLRKYE
tara:strand:+ start:534 stop:1352 length:819 start_codon:yes stop_codon:yes gene_type:complete